MEPMQLLLAAVLWTAAQPVVNLHARPSTQTSVVSQAIYGAQLKQIETGGDWVRVTTPGDDYAGWALVSSLRPGEYAGGVRVDTVAAHLYQDPDVTLRAPILTLPYDSVLEAVEYKDERWLRARLVSGGKGWIQRGDVRENDAPLSIPQVVDLSRKFLGIPYTWGGASSFGYDCSGFTQMLCRRRGVMLPRDSSVQAAWEGLETVTQLQIATGDLLFFGPSEGKINHTGFYLGNGEFIHATAHLMPRIQVSRLDDPHWAELLRACKRIK